MTDVCALSTGAFFPEFDLRLAALSLAHRVGVRGPVPLCTGWRGGAGCAGLCSPLQVSPLPSHRTCHTSQRASGAHPLRHPGEGGSQGGPGWAELPHQCSSQTSRAEGPPPARDTPSLVSQPGIPMGWALRWGPSVCELDPLTGCVIAYRAGDTLRHSPGSVLTESPQQGTLLGGRAG